MSAATVTIKDVARQAGVSAMTVSRVINGAASVSPGTRARVEQAIAQLGYVPSRLARGLSARRTGTLALIVPDVANPFFTLIVRGAEDVARRAGYRVILCDTGSDLGVEREVIEEDRKSTRLNSSHMSNSYAVFCLKKKNSDAQ